MPENYTKSVNGTKLNCNCHSSYHPATCFYPQRAKMVTTSMIQQPDTCLCASVVETKLFTNGSMSMVSDADTIAHKTMETESDKTKSDFGVIPQIGQMVYYHRQDKTSQSHTNGKWL